MQCVFRLWMRQCVISSLLCTWLYFFSFWMDESKGECVIPLSMFYDTWLSSPCSTTCSHLRNLLMCEKLLYISFFFCISSKTAEFSLLCFCFFFIYIRKKNIYIYPLRAADDNIHFSLIRMDIFFFLYKAVYINKFLSSQTLINSFLLSFVSTYDTENGSRDSHYITI